MSMSSKTDVPEQIRDMMTDEEIENMLNHNGWAYGTIIYRNHDGDDLVEQEIGDMWIELFNGEGRAGAFGGVRFMGFAFGSYKEAYAYPSEETARGNEPCYYVSAWIEPESPTIGPKYPDGPGVDRQ